MTLQERAFSVGRAIGKRPVATWLFCATERLLPIQRLARSRHAVALVHPRPAYDPHLLVVPSRPFPTLATGSMPTHRKAALLWDVITLAAQVANDQEPQAGWKLVFNGGSRQDIGHVHGHLLLNDISAERSYGWTLTDPADDLTAWDEVFRRIETLASDTRCGYSLVITWESPQMCIGYLA